MFSGVSTFKQRKQRQTRVTPHVPITQPPAKDSTDIIIRSQSSLKQLNADKCRLGRVACPRSMCPTLNVGCLGIERGQATLPNLHLSTLSYSTQLERYCFVRCPVKIRVECYEFWFITLIFDRGRPVQKHVWCVQLRLESVRVIHAGVRHRVHSSLAVSPPSYCSFRSLLGYAATNG